MKRPVAFACSGLLLVLALLPAVGRAANGLGVSSDQPIHITADRVRYDAKTKKQVYEGQVMLQQAGNEIQANRIEVTNTATPEMLITATGTPVQVKLFDRKRNRWINGQSQEAVYNNQKQELVFRGQAVLTSDSNVARGDVLIYNLTQENFVLKGRDDSPDGKPTPGGRVRITIQPNTLKSDPAP